MNNGKNEVALAPAIATHAIIAFNYHVRRRVVEPHDLGVVHGETQLLAYQVEGGSRSGGIPAWRRFDVGDIEKTGMLAGSSFASPRREWIRRKPHWDRRITAVH